MNPSKQNVERFHEIVLKNGKKNVEIGGILLLFFSDFLKHDGMACRQIVSKDSTYFHVLKTWKKVEKKDQSENI